MPWRVPYDFMQAIHADGHLKQVHYNPLFLCKNNNWVMVVTSRFRTNYKIKRRITYDNGTVQ